MARKLCRVELFMPLDIPKDGLNDRIIRKPGSISYKYSSVASSIESGAHQKPTQVTVEDWGPRNKTFVRPCNDEETDTYACLLRRCGQIKCLSTGKSVHSLILNNGHIQETFLGNLLVQMYGKCGAMQEATAVFANMPRRNAFSWNLLIGAYIMNGQGVQALPLYRHMQQEGVMPDMVTFVSILSACVSQAALAEGKWVHVYILSVGFESDVVVGTALLNLYGKCGRLNDAENMFDKLPEKNVICWNSMITVNTQHGKDDKAIQLFRLMDVNGVIPNKVTFITLLPTCNSEVGLAEGKRMHVRILQDAFESDVNLDNALINMYGKCGALDLACSVFGTMAEQDVVSWNIMVEAYVQHGQSKKALYLFQQMQLEDMFPDEITFVSILSACVSHTALAEGKQLHSRLKSCGFDSDVVVGTALVNMYAKCGSLENARKTFNEMPHRNVVSWNAMIAAYAQHGSSNMGLQLFQQMQSEGVTPNDSTFFSVLSACSHTGLVDEGHSSFCTMIRHHCITPAVEHFNCVIDLLGRAGLLDEGEGLIIIMPCQPNAASWSALLNACRMHLDVERGRRIAERIIKIEPQSAVPYVSLSNIYAAVGRWDDAAMVRETMREKGLMKQSGSVDDEFRDDEFLICDAWNL